MFDLKIIRDDPLAFDAARAKRGLAPMAGEIVDLDELVREAKKLLQEFQEHRNTLSKRIGIAKSKGEDTSELMEKVSVNKDIIKAAEVVAANRVEELKTLMSGEPNLPEDEVPAGTDEADNQEIKRWGDVPSFDFAPKEHFDIGEGLGLMDFETAARMSGSRFVILTGALARLERALAQFMLDMHTTEFGYTEVSPPLLVREQAAYGTGNLPKFKADLFKTEIYDPKSLAKRALESVESKISEKIHTWVEQEKDSPAFDLNHPPKKLLSESMDIARSELTETMAIAMDELTEDIEAAGEFDRRYLIPTAEMSLTNLVADQIVDEDTLPKRVTAYTPCFRSEAGSAGKDTRGMIRLHQFTKVELVSITRPEESADELYRMLGCAEAVLQRLGLAYRVVLLCGGDMGFSAKRTYDIEVWLPGQDAYREISSCSNCGDFQARRMKARFRRDGQKGTEYVHTLNGSALAVGRCLVALLENYQRADGSVDIPEVLHPYMGGMTRILSA